MKPFVSICTPTYNRRPFIPYLKKCILKQDYPLSCIEWIIIDDGVDKIKDLIDDLSFVVYLPYNEVISLGKKRNIMNEKSKGEFIIYLDDDDYYPPDRISHGVEKLQQNPSYLIAGSSEMHCYFSDLDKLYQFGPYRENHATAATFIFRKELLADVKLLGEDKFQRVILNFAKNKKQLTFLELREQIVHNVLFVDDSYNDNIAGKYFRKDFA